MSGATSPVVSVEDYGAGQQAVAARWITELQLADKETTTWVQRGRAIEKRYRDERAAIYDGAVSRTSATYKFNVLWSNVQTLMPAIYARPPRPVVGRRYRDRDPVGRAASQIIERGLSYQIECIDLHETVKQAVQDYLLCGRGQVWVRYEPKFAQMDADTQVDPGADQAVEPAYEEVEVDYVFWNDFQTSPARVWQEVRWVARRMYMTRAELRERFKDKPGLQRPMTEAEIDMVPLDWKPKHLTDQDVDVQHQAFERAQIWEIWNKEDRTAYWVCEGYGARVLDQAEDPLGLEGFFPCPRPLMATTTNGTLVPVPDYAEYQDQADQLDDLTGRIAMVTKAVKVMGVYASAETEVARMFQEGTENQLIPITNWPAFVEKGGLGGVLSMLETERTAKVLRDLTEIRAVIKNDLYEITGIADIIRGSTQANETATAQQIKGRYATMRLSDKQGEVARFVRDILRMMAEVMCEHFQPQTLLLMSDYDQSDDPGMEGMRKTIAAIQLIKNDKIRSFRIDIEDESTIAADDQQDKQSRIEFLTAVSGFLQQAVPAGQQVPELAPLLGKMLLFGVRAFRSGRDMETSIEDALAQMEQAQRAAQGQPKPPTPEEIAAQAEQARTQADMAKAQMVAQEKAQQAEVDGIRAQADYAIKAKEMEIAAAQAERDHEFKMADLHLKLVQAQTQSDRDAQQSRREDEKMAREAAEVDEETAQTSDMADRLDKIEGGLMEVAATTAQSIQKSHDELVSVVKSLGGPKRIIRGPDGRAIGVEPMTVN